jgi:hypothetical protein
MPPWDMEQAEKSIRVRNAGDETASLGPVLLEASSPRKWGHRPFAVSITAAGCP